MVIIAIPVIGWLVCLIWACGGSRYQNKRNFARAILIMFILGALVSMCVYFLMKWIFGAAISAAASSSGGGDGLLAARQILESLLKYVDGLIAARGR
jgi:hypothetical protein